MRNEENKRKKIELNIYNNSNKKKNIHPQHTIIIVIEAQEIIVIS